MSSLQPYFDLYQFPTGRRLFAMQRVAQLCGERDVSDIRALAEAAVQQAKEAADLETAWRRSRSTREGRRVRAAQIDNQLDRMLGGMNTHLSGLMQAFGDADLGARHLFTGVLAARFCRVRFGSHEDSEHHSGTGGCDRIVGRLIHGLGA